MIDGSIKKKDLLRHTDRKEFNEIESKVVSELLGTSELLKRIFTREYADYKGIACLEDPLLYGTYTNTDSKLIESFTITLFPTANEKSWLFDRKDPATTGLYQDRSFGIGLVQVLHLDRPGIHSNKRMIFECEYLPSFQEKDNKIEYICNQEYPGAESWNVDWSRDNNGVKSSGTAKLFYNSNYSFTKQSRELYEMNIARLYLLNSENKQDK